MRSVAPPGLGDAFELGTQPWLRAIRLIDRLGERQRLAARGDRLEGSLVGISRKRHCGWRRPVPIHLRRRAFESWRQRSGSIVLRAGLGSLTWLRGHGRQHLCIRRRPIAGLQRRLARWPSDLDFGRHDPLSEAVLEIGARSDTSRRHDEPDQQRLAVNGPNRVRSGHWTAAPACMRVSLIDGDLLRISVMTAGSMKLIVRRVAPTFDEYRTERSPARANRSMATFRATAACARLLRSRRRSLPGHAHLPPRHAVPNGPARAARTGPRGRACWSQPRLWPGFPKSGAQAWSYERLPASASWDLRSTHPEPAR